MRRVKPLGGVAAGLRAKFGVDLKIVTADEFADLLFALDHHRQRGCLHPANRGQEKAAVARVERCHSPRAVDADQPVRLGAATCRIGQGLHLRVAAQVGEAIADCLRRHGLQPQAAHRFSQGLGTPGVLFDQAEDQLALAPRVAGVDELVHVFAFGQFHHRVQAGLGFINRLQIEVRRNHRQMGKAPFAAFHIKGLRGLDFHQMPHGAGDHVLRILKVLIMLLELAARWCERPHDVLRHGGLLRNHQGFGSGHGGGGIFGFHVTTIHFSRARRRTLTQVRARAPIRFTIPKFLLRGLNSIACAHATALAAHRSAGIGRSWQRGFCTACDTRRAAHHGIPRTAHQLGRGLATAPA